MTFTNVCSYFFAIFRLNVNEFDCRNQFDLKNDRSSLEYFPSFFASCINLTARMHRQCGIALRSTGWLSDLAFVNIKVCIYSDPTELQGSSSISPPNGGTFNKLSTKDGPRGAWSPCITSTLG